MSVLGQKRKASHPLRELNKWTRIEVATSLGAHSPNVEEGMDEYRDDESEGSSHEDQSEAADTPITPFSPPTSKFPSDRKNIKCPYEGCPKTFNRPARLQSHIRSHTNERPFICDQPGCGKAYLERKHLMAHIKGTHTDEREYRCGRDGCDKSFLTATRLRRHLDAHEGRDRFRCTDYPPCNQTFRKHQTLQRHIRSEHLDLAPFQCTHVDSITNIMCDAGFDGESALKKHVARLHGPVQYFCSECADPATSQPLGFATQAALDKHIRKEHANCIFCDVAFSSQCKLERHVDAQHTIKTPVPLPQRKTVLCTIPGCGKSFSKKSNMDAHVRACHEGKRFVCGSFDLTNSAKVDLWNGEGGCGKDFISKANLEDHVRTQHLGLPSLINTKKPKKQKVGREDEQSPKEVNSMIKFLTGAGYMQDEARNIPCTVLNCHWKFMRQYDLEMHLRSKHDFDLPLHDQPVGDAFSMTMTQEMELDRPLEQMYGHPDLDWEMQSQLADSGHWWIGGDDTQRNTHQDETWAQEEAEMRRLIDFDVGPENPLGSIDPAL